MSLFHYGDHAAVIMDILAAALEISADTMSALGTEKSAMLRAALSAKMIKILDRDRLLIQKTKKHSEI